MKDYLSEEDVKLRYGQIYFVAYLIIILWFFTLATLTYTSILLYIVMVFFALGMAIIVTRLSYDENSTK
ncbi:MAG: hypothetical protein SO061_05110 [Limosilactobacillus coleohominis]|nr:hypothetical protein [Limosilactobacillus coleohominis]MDY3702924.1 hypothetical protein [Limosilactobacillus coleohominis]